MEDNHNFVPTCPFLAQRCYLFVSPRYRRHDFCIIGRNFRQLENPGEPAGSDRPNFLTINYRNFGSAGFWQCSSSGYHYRPADRRHLMGLGVASFSPAAGRTHSDVHYLDNKWCFVKKSSSSSRHPIARVWCEKKCWIVLLKITGKNFLSSKSLIPENSCFFA